MKGIKMLFTKIGKYFLWIVCLSFLLIVFLLINARRFLTYNHPINGDILVIEGWLPPYSLEMMNDEIDFRSYKKILIVGTKHENESNKELPNLLKYTAEIPVWLIHGGILLSDNAIGRIDNNPKEITIYGEGKQALDRDAHISLFVNKVSVGGVYAKSNKDSSYNFNIPDSIKSIKSIIIYIDNDFAFYEEVRYFILDSIKVGNHCFKDKKDFLISSDDRLRNGLFEDFSKQKYTQRYLGYIGIKYPMETLDTVFYNRNNTLASATKFSRWYNINSIKGTSLDIVSADLHSRRTYLAYKKALGSQCKMGIYSLPDEKPFSKNSQWSHKLWVYLDEYLSLFATYLD